VAKQLLCLTNLLDYYQDSWEGVEVLSRFQLLSHLISEELTPDRAELIAEPVINREAREISWYTSVPGPITPFEDLGPRERKYCQEVLAERAKELEGLSRAFLSSASSNRRLAGQLLSRLLTQSGCLSVFMVGERPVVSGWGLISVRPQDQDSARPLSHFMTERSGPPPASPAPPPAPLPPVPAPPPAAGCAFSLWRSLLGFLLGLALLFLVFWLFVPAFGQILPWLWRPGPDLSALADSGDQESLRAELAALRDDYRERLLGCRPSESPDIPPAGSPSLPDPPPLGAGLSPGDYFGPLWAGWMEGYGRGGGGLGPGGLPADTPADIPMDQAGEGLDIPEDLADTNDFSFMEGCWASDAGLYNTQTKLPIIYNYCFDAQGRAQVRVEERDAQGKQTGSCGTTARAAFEDGKLTITEDSGSVCSDGSVYGRQVLTCQPGEGGKADCSLRSRGQKKSVPSQFSRIR
jgi:hypothetical protein